jgi:hypothetical protein
MPAATSPDQVSFYGFQPHDEFPVIFHRLIPELQPKDNAWTLSNRLNELLAAACLWNISVELTAQPFDLFGETRPYECDALVDFLITGVTLEPMGNVYFRYVASEQLPMLQNLIQQTLHQPLFPREHEQWSACFQRIISTSGPLTIFYRH